jgi:hypothetical protein
MQYILDKYEIEQIESFEGIKRLGITLFNAQQMLIQQAIHMSLSHSIIQ